ncbi:MAG: hypothetical protein V1660_01360 [archaeon]
MRNGFIKYINKMDNKSYKTFGEYFMDNYIKKYKELNQESLGKPIKNISWNAHIIELGNIQRYMEKRGDFRLLNIKLKREQGDFITGEISKDLRFITPNKEFHLDDLADASELILTNKRTNIKGVNKRSLGRIRYGIHSAVQREYPDYRYKFPLDYRLGLYN